MILGLKKKRKREIVMELRESNVCFMQKEIKVV